MEEAGVKLIYSLPGLKVHAKVALISRSRKSKNQDYAYFGTGNFHEGTAMIYCDHGLLTCRKALTTELSTVFDFLETQTVMPELKHLLVAQHNMQSRFLELIDQEIVQASKKNKARIVIKLNNIEDRVMIDKLYEASEAGVEIVMLIRGICCLKPDQPYSKNIRVVRLVDGFLEHARIFLFHNAGEESLFLASADWMNRNLYRRVEVGFPIYDGEVKEEILQFLDFQLTDNVKAYDLDANQTHIRMENTSVSQVRAQWHIYEWLKLKITGSKP